MTGLSHPAGLPDLNDVQVRARLAQGLPPVVRMLEGWHLTRQEQGDLLDLSPHAVRRALEKGRLPSLTRDQIMRLSLITGIYKALHTLYDDVTADAWPQQPNRRAPFQGQIPLAYWRSSGIPALLATRRLLDADCGGHFSASATARATAATLVQPEIAL